MYTDRKSVSRESDDMHWNNCRTYTKEHNMDAHGVTRVFAITGTSDGERRAGVPTLETLAWGALFQ